MNNPAPSAAERYAASSSYEDGCSATVGAALSTAEEFAAGLSNESLASAMVRVTLGSDHSADQRVEVAGELGKSVADFISGTSSVVKAVDSDRSRLYLDQLCAERKARRAQLRACLAKRQDEFPVFVKRILRIALTKRNWK
jgi:hypothetical protein